MSFIHPAIGLVPWCVLALSVVLSNDVLGAESKVALSWTSQSIEAKPAAGEVMVVGHFTFINRATIPVAITEIHKTCGCITANSDQAVYQPGASGVITVILSTKDAIGRLSKRLEVITDYPGDQSTTLTMTAILADGPTIQPRSIHWKQGGQCAAQSITVAMPVDSAIRITEVKAVPNTFVANMVSSDDGKTAEIVVTPISTEALSFSLLQIICSGGHTFSVFLQVDAND